MTELEKSINGPNVANIPGIGIKSFNKGMYNDAKTIFTSNNNNSKLALCHMHLEEYREAVSDAGKTNNVSTWRSVFFTCLRAGKFHLASQCGLEVIKYPDQVDDVVAYYSDLGHFSHLVLLFEQGLGLKDARIGIFTEPVVFYTKYVPEKVMDHCKILFSKLNVSKVVRPSERARLFPPAVYLYMQHKQYNSVVKVMMERIPAYSHDICLETIIKVRNAEVMYKAVQLYINMHSMEFTKLMEVMETYVDHSRVVNQLPRIRDWALQISQPYMKNVQAVNLTAVNEAMNKLYTEKTTKKEVADDNNNDVNDVDDVKTHDDKQKNSDSTGIAESSSNKIEELDRRDAIESQTETLKDQTLVETVEENQLEGDVLDEEIEEAKYSNSPYSTNESISVTITTSKSELEPASAPNSPASASKSESLTNEETAYPQDDNTSTRSGVSNDLEYPHEEEDPRNQESISVPSYELPADDSAITFPHSDFDGIYGHNDCYEFNDNNGIQYDEFHYHWHENTLSRNDLCYRDVSEYNAWSYFAENVANWLKSNNHNHIYTTSVIAA